MKMIYTVYYKMSKIIIFFTIFNKILNTSYFNFDLLIKLMDSKF
jgi:hypothetical protein